MAIGPVEIPKLLAPTAQISGGEHPVFAFDRVPYFERQARHGHRLLIPMLLRPACSIWRGFLRGVCRSLRCAWRSFRQPRSFGDALFQELRQLRRGGDRIGGHALLRVVRPGVVHRPFADLDVGKADIDPGRIRWHFADDGAGGDVAHMGRLFEVGDVQSQHDVDVFVAAVEIRGEVERMVAGEIEPRADVPHRGAQSFRQLDDMIPAVRRTGGEVGDDRDSIGGGESVGGFF